MRPSRVAAVGRRGSRPAPDPAPRPVAPAFIRRQIPHLRARRRGGPGADRGQGRPAARRDRHRDPRRRRRAAVRATPAPPSTAQRVRFDPGHVRALCATAPSTFTQVARNPAHSVEIGGDSVVFAPGLRLAVRRVDLAGGRRYGSLVDFENFVKLAWAIRGCTTRGGTVCEPSTCRSTSATSTWCTPTCATATSRSWGRSRRRAGPRTRSRWPASPSAPSSSTRNCVILGNVNVNSPLVWDGAMTGALRRVRRRQPGAGRRAVHPRRGDGSGDPRRRHRPGPRRDAGRRGPRPAHAARDRR